MHQNIRMEKNVCNAFIELIKPKKMHNTNENACIESEMRIATVKYRTQTSTMEVTLYPS